MPLADWSVPFSATSCHHRCLDPSAIASSPDPIAVDAFLQTTWDTTYTPASATAPAYRHASFAVPLFLVPEVRNRAEAVGRPIHTFALGSLVLDCRLPHACMRGHVMSKFHCIGYLRSGELVVSGPFFIQQGSVYTRPSHRHSTCLCPPSSSNLPSPLLSNFNLSLNITHRISCYPLAGYAS